MQADQIIPPGIPDYENAALLYESAALRLAAVPAEYKRSTTTPQLFSEAMESHITVANSLILVLRELSRAARAGSSGHASAAMAELRRLMARPEVIEALALAEEAAARPACRFNLDYHQGAEMLVPNVVWRHPPDAIQE